MQGVLKFELAQWTDAAKSFKEAQMVYENLVSTLPEEEQFIYKSKIDELTPSLRYCAYNIGGNAKMDDLIKMRGQGLLNDFDALINQTKNQSLEAFKSIEWRGKKITVRSEKIRLFLVSMQSVNETIQNTTDNQEKIKMIEQILIDCKDAIIMLKDEVKQDPKFRNSTGESLLPGIQILFTYLSHTRIMMTIERTMYLITQLKANIDGINSKQLGDVKKARPQDISRLYEIILQNVNELQQLQGFENDQTYLKEVGFLAQAFKAFRCYYIALTLVNVKRWKEAVAMYDRSIQYAQKALQSKCYELIDLKNELSKLLQMIEKSEYSAQAYSVLEIDTGNDVNLYGKTVKSNKCLFERLSEYREDPSLNSKQPNIFKMPPEMIPIPCKPLFFDLAWNFVEFPSLDDKIQTIDGNKGLSGLVKGFLGWGNK